MPASFRIFMGTGIPPDRSSPFGADRDGDPRSRRIGSPTTRATSDPSRVESDHLGVGRIPLRSADPDGPFGAWSFTLPPMRPRPTRTTLPKWTIALPDGSMLVGWFRPCGADLGKRTGRIAWMGWVSQVYIAPVTQEVTRGYGCIHRVRNGRTDYFSCPTSVERVPRDALTGNRHQYGAYPVGGAQQQIDLGFHTQRERSGVCGAGRLGGQTLMRLGIALGIVLGIALGIAWPAWGCIVAPPAPATKSGYYVLHPFRPVRSVRADTPVCTRSPRMGRGLPGQAGRRSGSEPLGRSGPRRTAPLSPPQQEMSVTTQPWVRSGSSPSSGWLTPTVNDSARGPQERIGIDHGVKTFTVAPTFFRWRYAGWEPVAGLQKVTGLAQGTASGEALHVGCSIATTALTGGGRAHRGPHFGNRSGLPAGRPVGGSSTSSPAGWSTFTRPEPHRNDRGRDGVPPSSRADRRRDRIPARPDDPGGLRNPYRGGRNRTRARGTRSP